MDWEVPRCQNTKFKLCKSSLISKNKHNLICGASYIWFIFSDIVSFSSTIRQVVLCVCVYWMFVQELCACVGFCLHCFIVCICVLCVQISCVESSVGFSLCWKCYHVKFKYGFIVSKFLYWDSVVTVLVSKLVINVQAFAWINMTTRLDRCRDN